MKHHGPINPGRMLSQLRDDRLMSDLRRIIKTINRDQAKLRKVRQDYRDKFGKEPEPIFSVITELTP